MAETTDATAEPIRIGLSACLRGDEVRFNGGHSRQRYLTDTLGQFFVEVASLVEDLVGTHFERNHCLVTLLILVRS